MKTESPCPTGSTPTNSPYDPRCVEIISAAFRPPSTEPADQWVERNVSLGTESDIRGRVSFRFVPQSRFILQQAQNPRVRKITAIVSTQSAKTKTMEFVLMNSIVNDPAETAWYTDTDQSRDTFYKTRLKPDLETLCPAVAELMPTNRAQQSKSLVQFATMNLHIFGATSKRNREQNTIARVFIDEARRLKPGALGQIEGRFKSIRKYKRLIFSSAGELFRNQDGQPAGDELWMAFLAGSRHLLFWPCPHCGHKQTFRFGRKPSPLYPAARECGGFVWDDNPTTHPSEDVYNFEELGKTVRYECENPACRHHFTNVDKVALVASCVPVQTNPMTPPDDISIHWWEAYMPWSECDWDKTVAKFLRAMVACRNRNIAPLRVVTCETFAEPWEDQQGESAPEGELLNRCGEYSIGEEWPTEKKTTKILSFDNQHGFIHALLRQWTPLGESRLVDRIKFPTFDDLRAYQLAKGVKDFLVGGDVAHKPHEVFETALRFGRWLQDQSGGKNHTWNGWMPLLGDDAEDFATMTGVTTSIRTYHKAIVYDMNIGKAGQPRYIHRWSWSGPHYKSELYLRRVFGKGPLWEIPKNIEADYFKQIQATSRVAITDGAGLITGYEWRELGRHDDGDCELMQLVIADVRGVTRQT